MDHETFFHPWDRVTLSPEADARIQEILRCTNMNPSSKRTGQKLPKLLLAAVLSALALAITAGAIAISRLDLTVSEERTSISNQYNIFIAPWEGAGGPHEFWYPEALVEDFKPIYVSDLQETNQSILFQNKQGDCLELAWCTSSAQLLGSTRGSSQTMADISVNGADGYRFDHDHPEELGLSACTLLCWTAPDKDVAFRLEYQGVSDSTPDLLAIAESVAPQKKPLTPSLYEALEAFGDWRITALPEGYSYDGAQCEYLEALSAEEHPYGIYQFYLAKDNAISLRYSPVPNGNAAAALEKATAFFRADRVSVSVNGSIGYYVNSSKAACDYLYWVDEPSGLIFTLSAEILSQEAAISLAESADES